MGRRTDVDILVAALTQMPSNQASPRRLATDLRWDVDKVERVVSRANKELKGDVYSAQGGVVKYRGLERVSSNGLYDEVANVIKKHWGPKVMGLRNILTIPTATAGKRTGRIWTHPDLVLAADPRRRASASEPRRLHAVEIETRAGFDIRSIYQAHAQGHGADYSWVFGSLAPSIDHADWHRVLRTARQLSVGVVIFDRAGVYGTWRTEFVPSHSPPSASDRTEFLSLALGPSLTEQHDLR